MKRGSRRAGFSLLELVFAFLIAATALVLAGRLLLEAESRMAHAARRALDPAAEIVRQQLRADLMAAAGVRRPSTSGWSVLTSVTTFRWRLRGGSVEVDLGHRVTPRLGRLAAGGVREAPLPAEDRRLLRVTPRGDGGRQW